MILPVATVATENCYDELRLTMFSLEQYHKCKWYISCDQYVYDRIHHIENVVAKRLVTGPQGNHNSRDPQEQTSFLKVVLTKFDICKAAIADEGGVLFLDSDMLFVNEFEPEMLKTLKVPSLDAIISQHMTNNWKNEAHHGYFNVGMFFLRNTDLIDKWRYLSENHRKLNMYYEQKPLEYVQRNFITANFPINYNIGWWRFNEAETRSRLEKLVLERNKIFFGSKPAVNFHMHVFKESQMNYGKFLVDKVSSLMKISNNRKYDELLEYIATHQNS